MSGFEQDFTKLNKTISFNEKVHVFDMSKPAPSPKSPKRPKIITPILKQSPNTSSDEECDYLPPTYKQSQPTYQQSELDCQQSCNTGTMQSEAFFDEIISELKNHQQKVTLTSLIKGHARLFFSRKKSSLPSDFHVID